MKLKQKQLLRSYKFRDYLKAGGLNRKSFVELPEEARREIVKGFKL